MIRTLDILLSFLGLVFLCPIMIIIAIIIKIESKGKIIFTQIRVGRNNCDFTLFKFRTMFINSEPLGFLTIGSADRRITKIGRVLRKFKLDELPQLLNVLKGDMSIVGPRPEVRKFVDHYSDNQMRILNLRPGITDYASIIFKNENELLRNQLNPELFYIEKILPQKIALNFTFIDNPSIINYFSIIIKTIKAIFTKE